MDRERITPRRDWQAQLEAVGFHFHSLDGSYWDESACYRFSAAEVDVIEAATAELHEMSLKAVDEIVARGWIERYRLERFGDFAVDSWRAEEVSLYGRFDFRYDGKSPPKLLEYNADTPTSLIEAAVAQWNWLQGVRPQSDQFNSIHEKLIARWQLVRAKLTGIPPAVHFACVRDNEEDIGNIEYLRGNTAMQADIDARFIAIEDIGWSEQANSFVDLDNLPIRALFKLYPWEWMAREDFGPNVARSNLTVIEPAWKVLLSCKAILAVLWELYPDHPNLLPAYFEPGKLGERFVKKPLYSREGANVEIHGPRGVFAQPGTYGAEGYVYQAYAPLPAFDGNYPVIGSWIVGDEPCGMGIREDKTPVTSNTSRFIPHYFE